MIDIRKSMIFHDEKNPLIPHRQSPSIERNHVYDVHYTSTIFLENIPRDILSELSKRRDGARFAKSTLVGGIFVGMRKLGQ